MQSKDNPLRELIDAALAAGLTRSDLMGKAQCTRMQLWRLYNGKTGEKSKAAKRLRSAIQPAAHVAADERQIVALIEKLVSGDTRRAAYMLQMLRGLAELLAQAKPRS